jgi:hypothetical protein
VVRGHAPRISNAELNNLARHQFAVFALAAIAIASSFWLLLDLVAVLSKETQSFGVDAFEKRFELLHKDMPPHGVMGYVSDNPANDEVTSQGEFYLTQYTLAPVIIKPSTEEPLEIANFHTAKPNADLLKAKHLVDVRDYGNDVHLYRNTTK